MGCETLTGPAAIFLIVCFFVFCHYVVDADDTTPVKKEEN